MRLKTYENLFLIFLCAIALLSGYRLFLPPNYFSDSQEKGIAVFESIDNVVMEKGNHEISWKESNQLSQLNNGDLVYTHKNSQAKINLIKGPQLNLLENTLVKIISAENKNKIDIKKGLIYARITEDMDEIQINLAGQEYVLSAKNADIQIDTTDTSKITVIDGSLNISRQEKNIIVKKNEQASFSTDASKEIEIQKLSFIPISPTNNFERWSKIEPTIDFKWESFETENSGNLLIAKSPDFKNLLKNISINARNELSLSLPFGKYFWKIQQKSQSNILDSAIHQLSLKQEKPVVLLAPLTGEKLYLSDSKSLKGNKVIFRWKDHASERYQIELTRPSGQKEMIEVSKLNKTLNANQFGEYSYRVKVLDENRPEAIWSSPNRFEVLKLVNLKTPQILYPNDKEEFVPYNDEPIKLSWLGVQNASKYELSLNIDGSRKTHELAKTFFEFTSLKNSKITWQVVAKNANHQSLPSIERSFQINMPISGNLSPEQGTRIELDKPDQEVEFKWTLDKDAPVYLFELAKDSQFTDIVEAKKTKDIKIKTTVKKPGVYFWRAKILMPNGEIKYSRPQEVKVTPSPPPAPIKLIPKRTFELNLNSSIQNILENLVEFVFPSAIANEKEKTVQLEWEPSKKAKKYIIEIYQDSPDSKPLKTEEITESSYQLNVKNYGVFFWRVAIIVFWDRQTDFSNFSEIEIIPPQAPKKAPLYSPKHGIEYKEPFPKELTFKWGEIDNSKHYRFLISEDLDFTKIVFDRKVQDNSLTVSIDDIPKRENLYWRIISEFTKEKETLSYRRRISLIQDKPETKNILAKEKPKKDSSSVLRDHIEVALSPQLTSFSQESDNFLVDLSGSTTPGIGIRSNFKINEFSLNAQLSSHWGTVFETESYRSTQFTILNRFQKCFLPLPFSCEAGFRLNQISTYDQISTTQLTESAQLGFSAIASTARTFRIFNQHFLNLSAELGLGTMFHLGLNINWNKAINQKYYYYLESKNQKSWGTLNDRDIDLTTSSFEVGLGYFFN